MPVIHRGAVVKSTVVKLVAALTLGLVAAPVTAESQQASKVYRVGFLHWGSPGGSEHQIQIQAFEQALRQRGWVTGQNLVITYRYAEGQYDRLPALAGELVRIEPHVIVALPTVATRAAKDVTSTIPIVMMNVSDPIGERFITSFARPGANVTGLAYIPTLEIYAKQLQLLKEAVPRAQRIAVLRNPANPATASIVRTVEDAARALGVELRVSGARAPEEFEPAFRAMTQARADALLVVADSVFSTHKARLFDLSRRHRLPTMSGQDDYAKAGGLMSYAANRTDLYRRAAGYVDRLLRGASPAELPVEQPTTFELVVNLKTAKAIGFTIPASVLAQADQVIQ
jgi:putative tryptophan/tyrosine transport system substrate-binding protein